MRKFVGYVNGKSFDNEEDFNIAADEAIKSNDGNLAISSYYSYIDDNKETEQEKFQRENPDAVDQMEYTLMGVDCSNKRDYTISDKLKKRLQNASNKNEIRTTVTKYISNLTDEKKEDIIEKEELIKDIETLQKKLSQKKDWIEYVQREIEYYEYILSLVNEEPKSEKKELPNKDKIKEIFKDTDGTITLRSIFKQLGLID